MLQPVRPERQMMDSKNIEKRRDDSYMHNEPVIMTCCFMNKPNLRLIITNQMLSNKPNGLNVKVLDICFCKGNK
jgi:hypothetical protein